MWPDQADESKAQEDVWRHPCPAGVPALKERQNNAEANPDKRDAQGVCITHEEEEGRSREAAVSAPPL